MRHVALAGLALASSSALAGYVDFTEFGYIGLGTDVLLDTNPVGYDFASLGLSFSDSTFLTSHLGLLAAGGDIMGITNHDSLTLGGRDMTVHFLGGATEVTFEWAKLTAETFEATAYDADGNVVDSYINTDFFLTAGVETLVGDIAWITFNDRGQRIGVGTISWLEAQPDSQIVPLPTAGGLAFAGLTLVASRRRR